MARELTFKLKKKDYQVVPVRVDRKKLYGFTEIIALDDNGDPCTLVSVDDSGKYIIPKMGTGIGIVNTDGYWVERAQLKTVDENGEPAKIVPSSYSTVIELSRTVSTEEFLDHNITAFYQLENVDKSLYKAIGGDIYMFDYTYLDSYDTNPAFVMVADGIMFMLTGVKNKFEMLCFGDCGDMDDQDYESMELEDSDELDFSMF